jgi:hypothetical protein
MEWRTPVNHARLLDALQPAVEILESDGFGLEVGESGGAARVQIVAGADACHDCLIPRDVMLMMLQQMVADAGLPPTDIDLVYPPASEGAAH